MQTIPDSLRIISNIRNTITVNAIINGIRHIPLIGKHIPETIYRVRVIKIIALIISVQIELAKAFLGKLGIFAVLLLISIPIGSIGYSSSTVFLYVFTVSSLILTFFTNVFHITAEAKYAVIYLGMDAKKYILSILFYHGFTTFTAYLLFGIPAALLAEVPWYFAVFIPFAGLGLLFIRTGLMMYFYSLKISAGRRVNKKGVPFSIAGNTWLNILLQLLLFFGGSVGALWVVNYDIHWIWDAAVVLFSLLTIPGLLLVRKFPYGLYRTAMFAEEEHNEITLNKQQNEVRRTKELKFGNAEAKSDKTGFAYLNDLFIKRHGKVLYGRMIGTIIGTTVLITLLSVYLHFELDRFGSPEQSTLRYVFSKHPGIFVFFLFTINSTASFARVLYANCDSALLNYAFYKTPRSLLSMFIIRCKSAVLLNLAPAAMAAVFAIVTLILTGGRDYPLQYFFTLLEIFIALVLFCVRHMLLYYILQPYNSDFMIKSHVYNTLSFFSGVFYTVLVFIPVNAMFFCAAGVIIGVPFVILAGLLVRKFAPRTFRIR